MTDFLTTEDLVVIAKRLGGEANIRDFGLLEAAVARPQATVFGEDAYPGLEGKAAALLSSLVRNHALVDGNNRLGWLGCRLFLALNGVQLAFVEDDAFELVMDIARGSLVDVEKIAAVLRTWMPS